jgi:ribosome-binding factor A
MAHSAAPSQRMLRAGELIRHALAEILLRGETNDPELDKLTASIVEVKISPDLKIATAFVRTLIVGQDALLLEALNRNRKYIRMLMTPRLAMKYTPDIRFRIDTSLEYAVKIDAILRKPAVRRDIESED